MSFSAETKIYCKFDDLLFTNEVNGSNFSESGSHSSETGTRNNAVRLNADSYLSTSESLGITNQFSIGFWLESSNVGLANSGSVLESIRLALLSKSGFSYAANYVSLVTPQFVIYEKTYGNSEHDINVYVKGATDATVTSEKYDTSIPHFFWISYDGTANQIKIWIDGTEQTTSTSGTIPSSLDASAADFEINRWVDGDSYKVARNVGLLDELVVLNTSVTDEVLIGRVINLGVEYAFDSDYTDFEEIYIGEVFNDPSTIKVNTITSDTSNVFVGRSDGKLIKGERTIWQNKRDFSSESEKTELEKKYGSQTADTYQIADGHISIKSITIRI